MTDTTRSLIPDELLNSVHDFINKMEPRTGPSWGMQFYRGPETEDFEDTVDDTSRFTVGKGCWGLLGPTIVVSILDQHRLILRPVHSLRDLLAPVESSS